jgi:hypothetical protein
MDRRGRSSSGGGIKHDSVWGPTAPRSQPIRHAPGYAVGEATISGAVDHLHMEHPHHVQGEGLQHDSSKAIHHPITDKTYSKSTI